MAEQRLKTDSASEAETREPRRGLPVVDAPKTQPQDEQPSRRAKLRPSRRWVRWGLFALLPIVLILGGYWYVTGGQVISMTDAYVNAEKVGVSTDVSGIVQDVDVVNNQHVAKGQVLYRLEPQQFQLAVDQARANLEETASTINATKRDYQGMLSDVAAQQAQVNLDQTNYNRAALLLREGSDTQAAYDQAKYTLQADKNKLTSLRQQAGQTLARLNGNASLPTDQLPQYKQAQAQLGEAERNFNHSVVRAPFAGTVTDVPNTAPGRYLPASTVAFYLVDTDHVWIDAMPKETALTYVRVGQPATITVDAYPGSQWRGRVQSISPAAAEEFSLLPAENTTGNWVKVVQRVPMRVSVDTTASMPPLRAGMSVEVAVNTGHARGLPHFLTGWF